MPLFTRSASKKQKLSSSLGEELQISGKVSQRRNGKGMVRRQDAQQPATVSIDARARYHLRPRLRADARGSTKVEALPLATPPIASTVMPLKGHKKFNSDLRELITGCSFDLNRGIWSVQKLKAGEDDGSVEFELIDSRDRTIIVVHLLCSDTSEYPNSHSFFCHSPNPGSYEEQMKDICDWILNSRPRTIHDVVEDILNGMSCDEDEDSEDEEHHDDDIGIVSIRPEVSRSILRRDFYSSHTAGYIPGIIWNSNSEFILTVSVPVVELTEKIPAHVLMSWDSQFLTPCQHLVLAISGFRGVYPPIRVDGTLTTAALWCGTSLKFNVGFTRQYKPSMGCVTTSFRRYGFQLDDDVIDDDNDVDGEPDNSNGTFDKLSLSSSFESLLNDHFLQLLRLRQQFNIGWAAAEELRWRSQQLQKSPAILVAEMQDVLRQADEKEQLLVAPRHLPDDPLERQDDHINLPETAFAYFLRRLTLCSRYCAVCHKKLNSNFEALKPYVCDSGLCAYQYYSLNFGPSLEYDICKNTEVVDLLVSLAYSAAEAGVLDEPLPRGLGLKVPKMVDGNPVDNSLLDFDTLNIVDMRRSIKDLINSLPSIEDMKKHLEKRVPAGTSVPKLKDIDPHVPPAAWSILRWCVASCTAHLQELTEEDRVQNIGPEWRQFRLTVGAPDKEAKFKEALEKETSQDANAAKYPTLYAFHGSPLKNWHSIIRHGLWYKRIANGRAHGHGVYFAQDGSISAGYALAGVGGWKNSMAQPSACVALAEIINLPHKFTSYSPYYVVNKTEWIMCRYLLVQIRDHNSNNQPASQDILDTMSKPLKIPFMKHDSQRRPLLNGKAVEIPQPSYKLQKLLALCKESHIPPVFDKEDEEVFDYMPIKA